MIARSFESHLKGCAESFLTADPRPRCFTLAKFRSAVIFCRHLPLGYPLDSPIDNYEPKSSSPAGPEGGGAAFALRLRFAEVSRPPFFPDRPSRPMVAHARRHRIDQTL